MVQFGLAQKLAKCRDALKAWSKKSFGNNLEKIKELKTQLRFVQNKAFSEEDFQREKAIKDELEMAFLREEMYQHQRSRLHWIKYGDKNTSFFHATVNQRRQRNQISKVKDDMGSWLTEERDINEHLQTHFSSLFKSRGQRNLSSILQKVKGCITEGMNRTLTRTVTDLEIKEAAFQLGTLTSPGPDGFNGLFFQLYWDTVGTEVCMAVKDFFSSGSLGRDFNLTDLVLIPKVQFPETLSHMRPISLCNFYLKIITKILANRLKLILKTIISPQQSAFVPGRMIQNSILIAHEAFHFLKRKKKGKDTFMAVKLDFNKAYDRVEWDFLEALMRKMGFADMWVGWVMETVASVNFSVLANGECRASVYPERGLRQGDPLSPYLFLIVKDVLSKLIQEELKGGHLAGMRINKYCPILSHIFFADDAIIFLKAELNECSILKSVLEKYCSASGQMVNFEKSGAFFSSNMCEVDRQLCCDLLAIKPLKGDSKYLGLPSFWGRSKAEAYTFLVEKAMGKMQGWKNKLISMGGKEILIKSVVQGIPTFALACFLLPKKICDKLDALTRNFWWRGNPEDRGICWASWDKLGMAKEEGGLGFWNHRAFNEAMLARNGWRLLMNPDAYWARVLKGIYFPNSSFLQATRGSRASWAWLSLLHGRNLLLRGLRWQVQDGKSIDFWNDAWIPSLPNFKVPAIKPSNSAIGRVADIIDPQSRQWDIQKLEKEVPAEVVNAVKDIPISHVERADQLVWHFNSNGCYSVKSGYHVAHQVFKEGGQSKPSPSFKLGKDFWKTMWKMKVPNKIKSFWWRTCLDILATKGNLFKRKCAKDNVCPICDSGEESIDHMLFSCPWANLVWFGCNIKPFGDLGGNSTVAKWAADMIEKLGSKDGLEFMGRVATIAWNIWKGRNDYVFNRAMVNPKKTIASIHHAELESVDTPVITSVHMDNPLVQEEVSSWRAPDFGKFKANCDVAISVTKNASKAAVVLRNWRGKVVEGAATTVRACSSLGGELYAIRAACEMLLRLGMKEVEVESDNKQAITLSVSELVPPWNVRALVLDIRQYAKEGAFLFKWARRSANKVAHEVASLALRRSLPCNWILNPPLSLVSVLNLDFNESQ